MGMGGCEDAKRSRSWLETKLPAKGERVTPFFRMSPSCTGVMEMVEAPMSTTRAVGFPEAKLSFISSAIWAYEVGDKPSENTASGKPESGTSPTLHGYFNTLLPIFAGVPARLGHEQRILP